MAATRNVKITGQKTGDICSVLHKKFDVCWTQVNNVYSNLFYTTIGNIFYEKIDHIVLNSSGNIS